MTPHEISRGRASRSNDAARRRRTEKGTALVAALLVLWILPAAGHPVLKHYQQQRLTGFMHSDSDPRGAS